MKKTLILMLILALSFGSSSQAWASHWDKAGIALTGLESLRVISGGKIDPIGMVFGMNNKDGYHWKKKYAHPKHRRGYTCSKEVWVPHYKWKRKYVPKHEEYHERYGKVIVEDHYMKYKVENGGHWETQYACAYR